MNNFYFTSLKTLSGILGDVLDHVDKQLFKKITYSHSQAILKFKIQEVGRAAIFWVPEAMKARKIYIFLMVPDLTNVIPYDPKELSENF